MFDADAGQDRKAEGMAAAANNPDRATALRVAREGARKAALSREDRTATADDSYAYLQSQRVPLEHLGPAAGSIFKGKEWVFTGEFVESTRETNNARAFRKWKLVA